MADSKKQPPKAGTVELDERDLDQVRGGMKTGTKTKMDIIGPVPGPPGRPIPIPYPTPKP